MTCDHSMGNTFDPVTRTVQCKGCGKVMARVKAKPGAPKIMIKARKLVQSNSLARMK